MRQNKPNNHIYSDKIKPRRFALQLYFSGDAGRYMPEQIGVLTEEQFRCALEENVGWSETPIVKITMLGTKGSIGKYGVVHQEKDIAI